jgi:hypothetical protein
MPSRSCGTGNDRDLADVAKKARAERRKTKHQMHVDRRKSHIDVIEHVVRGVRLTLVRATTDGSSAGLRLKH